MEKIRGSGKPKSIKRQVAGVVLIPSVTLLVMWMAVSAYLVVNSISSRQVLAGVQQVSVPAYQGLASAQKERQLSMAYLADPSVGPALRAQQKQTDQGLSGLQNAAGAILSNGPTAVADRFTTLADEISKLPRIRAQVNARTIAPTDVYNFYNGLEDAASAMFDTQARSVPDAAAAQDGLTVVGLFRAGDLMSRAGSMISGAFSSANLSRPDYLQFVNLVGAYHAQLAQTAPNLRPDLQGSYNSLVGGAAWNRLVSVEDALVLQGPWSHAVPSGLPTDAADWQTLTGQVGDSLDSVIVREATETAAQTMSGGDTRLLGVIIGSVIALLAAIVAILVALRVSRALVDRSLVTRLARLRDDALYLAHERLPNLVRRLLSGETVDVRHELPELDYGRDEIGELASAFNAAQQTAVSAAVKEAQTRAGVHNVFLNIAHRSQALVHRQLKLLDVMEREEESADQLERLFQLDHLATRGRRNAENLIILGGQQPGRRWRRPVALLDVLRAAVSETEQYSRVKVERVPEVAIVGSAVADAIHLIAELVDNATSFSPPKSQAHVNSMLVARGVVVEVEDQGLGMSAEDRQRANAMMVNPPEFDAMALKGDSRFGFFVIARLAARLGIRVEFRSSPYGGTRAVVLIPAKILAATDETAETPADSTVELSGVGSDGADMADATGGERDARWSALRAAASVRRGEQRVPDQIQPSAPEPAPQPAPEPALESGQEGGALPKRLPRRRPQENLVRQLRDNPPAGQQPDGNGSNGAGSHGVGSPAGSPAGSQAKGAESDGHRAQARSAEEVRDAISAFQRGSVEGRRAGDSVQP